MRRSTGFMGAGNEQLQLNVAITPLLNPVERIEGCVVLAGGFVFEGSVDITAAGMKLDGILMNLGGD